MFKKSLITAAATLAIATVGAHTASAQYGGYGAVKRAGNLHTPGIDRRMDNQRHRIRKGIRKGQLTRFEARRLRVGLRDIRREKRYMARDGHIGRGERVRLHRMLDRNSHKIRRLKHNGRFAGRGWVGGDRAHNGRVIIRSKPRIRRDIVVIERPVVKRTSAKRKLAKVKNHLGTQSARKLNKRSKKRKLRQLNGF